jgi:hypothetical protein
MCNPVRFGLVLAGLALAGLPARAQPLMRKVVVGPTQAPTTLAATADIVVIGKVTEVEPDPVEAGPTKDAPADQKVSYKIAVVKIDEGLVGAGGVTRIRVGFPADAPAPGAAPAAGPAGGLRPGRLMRPPQAVALSTGMEGCFFLTRHPAGDFYTEAGLPLLPKDDATTKELERVRKIGKAVADPVTALKAKEQDDRFLAAHALLQRYARVPPGEVRPRRPIPDEENKRIVAVLAELPWLPDATKTVGPGEVPPSRSALWYLLNPQDTGFVQPNPQPQRPGDPPVDFNKVMDGATSKHLKEHPDKIQIKSFAHP